MNSVLCFVIACDLICSLSPFLPPSLPPSLPPVQFLTKKLGVDAVLFGYLQTASAVAMLLGGPLFGRFGDLFGAKAALLVAFIASFFFYFFLAIADNVYMLFLSRLNGFMMHAMHGESFPPSLPLPHSSSSLLTLPFHIPFLTSPSPTTLPPYGGIPLSLHFPQVHRW